MIKILYVVSTLAKCGPTNQLFNIINNQIKTNTNICVLTLSPEGDNSDRKRFHESGIVVKSLSLSRFKGVLFAKKSLSNFIDELQPTIIHSQGVRADFYLSKLTLPCPWVLTSRNFPPEDYRSRFGFIKGNLTVFSHLSALRKCNHIVSCSHAVAKKLMEINIRSEVIQNGVAVNSDIDQTSSDLASLERPIFITAGAFIPRKNMMFLVDVMQEYFKSSKGSLVVLGDGPLLENCKSKQSERIVFLGNVNEVPSYLAAANYFISTSLSEGLPNAVLEALSCGLPVILSDIESHREIAIECPNASKVFPLSGGQSSLLESLDLAVSDFDQASRAEALRVSKETFSDASMSSSYQAFYESILIKTKHESLSKMVQSNEIK